MRKELNQITCIVMMIMMVCISLTTIGAVADSTQIYSDKIIHNTGEQDQQHAIKRLITLQRRSSYPILWAINTNALYTFNDKIVTVLPSPSLADQVSISEIYPSYDRQQHKPTQVSRHLLQQITIGRSDRLQLAPINQTLELFNPNPQMRSVAYHQFTIKSDEDQQLLLHTLSKETDPALLKSGKETLFAYQLNTSTQTDQARNLIDSIYNNNGESALQILNTYGSSGRPASSYAQEHYKKLENNFANMQKIQNIFSGISLASILILISLGLGIVYGLAGIINMAHGEFLMVGAYATYMVQLLFKSVFQESSSDWFFIASLPLSFMLAGLIGLLLERLVISKLYAKPLESLLATWGVSLILIQSARWIFGDMTSVKLPTMLSGGLAITPHLILPYNRLFIIVLTIVVVLGVYWLLMRTRMGLQIRAVTQNRNMSGCLGIDTKRINAITFFIGSGLAGLAGCAMTLIGNVVPDMGQTYIVDSFLMVVIGGVGQLIGIIVSGLGIGVLSKIMEFLFEAVYGKVIILLLIIAFMQFRPKGLFPDKGRNTED